VGVRIVWSGRLLRAAILPVVLAFCAGARAQQMAVTFDPANTKVEFTLAATLHTVHGDFRLKRGEVRFNASTGNASGEIVVDATSGETGNADRDKKMHSEILESEKFPEITFTANHVNGTVPAQGNANVEVTGNLRVHGQDHPTTLNVAVTRGGNGDVQAATHFSVPYVKWGMKNPSTFVLRVSETVDLDITAAGRLN
jgi:polyisoprenoid-binding protein YceI